MDIVVDEWFLEYMVPGSEVFSLSNKFIDEIERRADRIVVRIPSRFTEKLYRFADRHPKYFTRVFRILYDENKVLRVDNDQVPKLKWEIEEKIPADDLYLVELIYLTQDKVFVTTDSKLHEILNDQKEIKVFLLNDFLKNYYKMN